MQPVTRFKNWLDTSNISGFVAREWFRLGILLFMAILALEMGAIAWRFLPGPPAGLRGFTRF